MISGCKMCPNENKANCGSLPAALVPQEREETLLIAYSLIRIYCSSKSPAEESRQLYIKILCDCPMTVAVPKLKVKLE